jgi:hypothetical protein
MFEGLVGSVGHDYTLDNRQDDFTIIIAHRGDPMGLWLTVNSCETVIPYGHKYSYVIVVNGEDTIPENTFFLKEGLEARNKCGAFIHHKSPLAPPTARQLGAEAATGKYLFFFDNHCIPQGAYFDEALSEFKGRNRVDLLHSATQDTSGGMTQYHYPLTLKDNFWVNNIAEKPAKSYTHRIAAAGAGAFAVTKSAFDAVGGYGPIGLFEGWGGEETYLDLKMAMFDKTVWLDPCLRHYHYFGNRSYTRHNTPEFYTNLLTSSYVLGGEKWLSTVSSAIASNVGSASNLVDIARSRGAVHRAWIESNATYTLDEVLEKFKREQVAH